MPKQTKQSEMVACPNCAVSIPWVREGDFYVAYHNCNKHSKRFGPVPMIKVPVVSEPVTEGENNG